MQRARTHDQRSISPSDRSKQFSKQVQGVSKLMLITNKRQTVRTRLKEIRETGRNTMGVKLMDLRNDEKLQAIAPVVSQAEEEEAQSAEAPAQQC